MRLDIDDQEEKEKQKKKKKKKQDPVEMVQSLVFFSILCGNLNMRCGEEKGSRNRRETDSIDKERPVNKETADGNRQMEGKNTKPSDEETAEKLQQQKSQGRNDPSLIVDSFSHIFY